MADVTLKTDEWVATGEAANVLRTDQWSFSYGTNPTVTLKTDLWLDPFAGGFVPYVMVN